MFGCAGEDLDAAPGAADIFRAGRLAARTILGEGAAPLRRLVGVQELGVVACS